MLHQLQSLVTCALAMAVLVVTMPGLADDDTLQGYRWQALGNGIFLHTRTDPLARPIDGNSVVVVNGDGVLLMAVLPTRLGM